MPTDHPPTNIAKWSPFHFGAEHKHYAWLSLSGWRYDIWAPGRDGSSWTLYVAAPMMNPGPARRSTHASASAAAKAARQHSINTEKHAARGQRVALTAAERKRLPREAFALPQSRQYPMDTLGRAKNARARAVQALQRGTLSAAQAGEVFRRTAERWGLDPKVVVCSRRRGGEKKCKSRTVKG